MVAARSRVTAETGSSLFSRVSTVKSGCPQRAGRHQGAGERCTTCLHQNLPPPLVALLPFVLSPLGIHPPDQAHDTRHALYIIPFRVSACLPAPQVSPLLREAEARLQLEQGPIPD